MAEELEHNLSTYKVQFQQVEASLTTDPGNEDLLKLKKDLEEVIELTEDLIQSQHAAAHTSGATSSYDDMVEGQTGEMSWSVGDRCSGVYSEDHQYYPATIDEILEDGTCTLTFDEYGNTEVMKMSLLRPIEVSLKRAAEAADSKKPVTKKDKMVAEREYKKKKAQKKAQRLKQLEEEREVEKNKWQSFNSKVFSKTAKGKVKKSIFASPDSVSGRVGVGTCGVSGKPMTQFVHRDKWKK